MQQKERFYSVTELAKALGVSRQAVLERIRRKTLDAIKIGPKSWAILAKEAQKAISQKKRSRS